MIKNEVRLEYIMKRSVDPSLLRLVTLQHFRKSTCDLFFKSYNDSYMTHIPRPSNVIFTTLNIAK